MKVKLNNINKFFSQEELSLIEDYICFLQDELPLINDIFVKFMSERDGKMTTGVRIPPNKMFILAKDRLIVDILRTLAHEWCHEFQVQRLGVENGEKIQSIGGPIENSANAVAGIIFKKFEKNNPELHKVIYHKS